MNHGLPSVNVSEFWVQFDHATEPVHRFVSLSKDDQIERQSNIDGSRIGVNIDGLLLLQAGIFEPSEIEQQKGIPVVRWSVARPQFNCNFELLFRSDEIPVVVHQRKT